MVASVNNKKDRAKKEIIKQLFFNPELSCTEISDLIGKSIPLTTQYLNELIETCSIMESGYANSTGGRRPQVYSLDTDTFYIISVGMDQLITRVALISGRNKCVGPIEKYDLTLPGNPNSLNQLIDILKSFIAKLKIPQEKIAGIGIGMPGFVDSKKGINHTFLRSENGSINNAIEKELGIPVLIDNDSSLIALAELKWGVAKNRENVMVINVGWGVGLGIIINGKLIRGHDGFAGEFSHIPLFENNKLCSCGKHGCLETETSLVVVAEKAVQGLKKGKNSTIKNLSLEKIEDTARKVIEAAQKGDKFSIEVLSGSAYNIGRGVAILIHLLNPELVVISGIGAMAGKVWIAPIQQAINEHCIPKIAENCELEISKLGPEAEIIGGAALVMENFQALKQHTKARILIS